MPQIVVKNLSVIYINRKKIQTPVFENFNIEFKSNVVNVLVGDSGCGKTTLLKAICSLFEYDGEITIDEVNVATMKNIDKRISYISQTLFLYNHMIVYDILAYPLKVLKIKPTEIDLRIKKIANEFKITELLTRKPNQLSIGQRQLVSIAKGLIKDPDILLLDEAFSNLDPKSFDSIKNIIKEIVKNRNLTVILVTHKLEEIRALGEQVYYIKENDVIFNDSVDNFVTSNNEEIKAFLSLNKYGKDR